MRLLQYPAPWRWIATGSLSASCVLVIAAMLVQTGGAFAQDASRLESVQGQGAYKPKGGLVLKMGDFEVIALMDRDAVRPASALRESATPAQWARAAHLLSPDGNARGTLGGFLIRSKNSKRLVIVDLGIGQITAPPMFPAGEHTMLQELAAWGYTPADVTDVVFTHLHLDHIGWATNNGKPTFPNAVYRTPAAEWEERVVNPVIPPQPALATLVRLQRDWLLPIQPQLKTFADRLELYPGLLLRRVPGHTAGSVVVQLDSGGRRALLLGDAAHSAMELQDTDWRGSYDGDHEPQARAVRSKLIEEAIATHADVTVSHMPGLRFGQIVRSPTKGLIFYFNEQ